MIGHGFVINQNEDIIQVVDISNTLVQVVARSKAWVCGRSAAEVEGSNPTGAWMSVCCEVLCVVWWRSLRRADHSSRGVLRKVVCRSV
jgi:hypothetical protein